MNPIDTLRCAPVTVLLHLAAALAALFIGAFVVFRHKGTRGHKFLGRSWVGLMLVVTLSSYFIQRHGPFSPLHALSVVMTSSLIRGVVWARQRQFHKHRRTMIACYASLWLAGLFALLPSRLLGQILFA